MRAGMETQDCLWKRRAILACYGWEDVNLSHNFYRNEREQVRYTISPESRRELLRRLVELNDFIFSAGCEERQ